MKKFYYFAMIALLGVAMSSCDDRRHWDEPYWNFLVGNWESVYGVKGNMSYDLYGTDVVRYEFYNNGYGRYYFYDDFGGYYYYNLEWESYDDRINIYYEDNTREYLYYDWDDYGYLLLSPDRNFYRYTAYRSTY